MNLVRDCVIQSLIFVCAPWARSNGYESRTHPGSGKCIAEQQAILTALDIMNDGNDWIVGVCCELCFRENVSCQMVGL